MTGLYCQHERLADACEDCAYAAAKKAGRPVPPSLRPEDKITDESSSGRRKSARSRAAELG